MVKEIFFRLFCQRFTMKKISVIFSFIYVTTIVNAQSNDRTTPTIYVTPVSVNAEINHTKDLDNDHNNFGPKYKRQTENLPYDIEPFFKKSAKRNIKYGNGRPGRASPPATSYGTPFNDFYNVPNVYLPPSGNYGPPFKPPPPTEAPTTEAPTTVAPTTPKTEEPTNPPAAEISSGYQYLPPQPQQTVINKNVYFYKPSEDFEEQPAPQQPINLPPPQRNVKVIFIQAPTFVAQPQLIPVVQQNEDKTLVYVLSKKPEVPEVVVPSPPPVKVSQPEVYFVRYGVKTEEKPPAYGVPQYGKGYSYDTPAKSLSEGENKSKSDSSEEGHSKDGSSDEKTKKKRNSVRRNRSSDVTVSDPILQFNEYYKSLIQRSRAFERR